MKIFHVIDSGGLYGAEVMLLHLAEEQMRQGHEPIIASITEPGISEKAINKTARTKCIPLQSFEMQPGPNIGGALSLVRRAREIGADLFHSHGYKGNILLGLLPKRVRALPVVATLHGYTANRMLSKMQIYEILDRLMLQRLDAVVLVNRQMKKHPRVKNFKHKKLEIIDNGIPLANRDDGINAEIGNTEFEQRKKDVGEFCKDGFIIGSVGRYSPEKGYDLLIKAVKKLIDQKYPVKLVLVGEGGKREELEALAIDLHIEKSVFLAGYYPQAWALMKLFNVYVISSHTEGLPITLLEAMRESIPVLATAVGGIPDVLEDGRCGTMVPPGDENILAAEIERLLNTPGAAMKKAALAEKRFASQYGANKMAAEYSRIYTEICP